MLRFDEYYQPKSIEETVALLSKYGKDARLMAGGTDVVAQLRAGTLRPKAVISLQNIPGLDEISLTDDGLTLGASANLMAISKDKELEKDFPAVMEAAGHVSTQQVRNMGTIGGNACNASPSADAIHGPLLYDAELEIAGPNGTRTMPFADFFKGPGKTALADDEMLLRFRMAKPKPHTGCYYKKFAIRGDSDISIIGVGARLTLDDQGVISDARITLGAVGPVPIIAKKAEQMLIGKKLSPALINQVADVCAEQEATPISDQRASKEYRVEMVRVWTRHTLEEAARRAAEN